MFYISVVFNPAHVTMCGWLSSAANSRVILLSGEVSESRDLAQIGILWFGATLVSEK